ncbi:glutamate racemase [Bacteroidota bacterium]
MIYKPITRIFLISIVSLLFLQCSDKEIIFEGSLSDNIIKNKNSFFYVDIRNYPVNNNKLPIGVFDSGTGGLTVLDAMINFDKFNNATFDYSEVGDGHPDFRAENFIYLGDKANMPYGEYSLNNNTDLLKEHVLKDVQFLLSNKYYRNSNRQTYEQDKNPVKVIVIACNTATAYGFDYLQNFMKNAELDIKVIGVIGAGVRAALSDITKEEDAVIGIMATNGTVCSNGYPNTISKLMSDSGYNGNVKVFQQAGVGLASAIDGLAEYIDHNEINPLEGYRGPSFTNKLAMIDKNILARYEFDWSSNKMLLEGDITNPSKIQINSIENYISYHLVSLLEQIKNSDNSNKLKSLILGCTHYPFFTDLFIKKLNSLYNYTENNNYVYRSIMERSISLIDPSINTAKELYEYLHKKNMFNNDNILNSEFYISIPNPSNTNNVFDGKENFTYDYKYGRKAGLVQEYVKRVPFSRAVLSNEVIERISKKLPDTFNLIKNFNHSNPKSNYLIEKEKI